MRVLGMRLWHIRATAVDGPLSAPCEPEILKLGPDEALHGDYLAHEPETPRAHHSAGAQLSAAAGPSRRRFR